MEKRNYQFLNVSKKGENTYNVTVKGWVVASKNNKPEFGTANINGVSKDTVNFTISGVYAKSKIKFLGLPESETSFIRCCATAEKKEGIMNLVDRLKKVNIRKGHLLLLVGTLYHKVTQEGKTYSTLYIEDFDVELRPKTEDTQNIESKDVKNEVTQDEYDIPDVGEMYF